MLNNILLFCVALKATLEAKDTQLQVQLNLNVRLQKRISAQNVYIGKLQDRLSILETPSAATKAFLEKREGEEEGKKMSSAEGSEEGWGEEEEGKRSNSGSSKKGIPELKREDTAGSLQITKITHNLWDSEEEEEAGKNEEKNANKKKREAEVEKDSSSSSLSFSELGGGELQNAILIEEDEEREEAGPKENGEEEESEDSDVGLLCALRSGSEDLGIEEGDGEEVNNINDDELNDSDFLKSSSKPKRTTAPTTTKLADTPVAEGLFDDPAFAVFESPLIKQFLLRGTTTPSAPQHPPQPQQQRQRPTQPTIKVTTPSLDDVSSSLQMELSNRKRKREPEAPTTTPTTTTKTTTTQQSTIIKDDMSPELISPTASPPQSPTRPPSSPPASPLRDLINKHLSPNSESAQRKSPPSVFQTLFCAPPGKKG